MAHLPDVVEVFPQIRFFTEVRYDGNPYTTMVAGMPDSARAGGSFDGMQGSFFSSPSADEAILQMEFAKELSDKPETLIGKELSLRYAERQSLGAPAGGAQAAASHGASDPPKESGKDSGGDGGDAGAAPGFSIVPRGKALRIVGIVDTEPAAGFGGFGSGRLLIPLQLAETLRAAQANDLRDIVRA
jgi:hypothetical protein